MLQICSFLLQALSNSGTLDIRTLQIHFCVGSNRGVSKTQTTDLENADLEKKKKRRTKGLKFITLASKGCFCVCATSVFSRSSFSRSALSKSAFLRTRKRRPRKHRRVTSTCSQTYYGIKEASPVVKPI